MLSIFSSSALSFRLHGGPAAVSRSTVRMMDTGPVGTNSVGVQEESTPGFTGGMNKAPAIAKHKAPVDVATAITVQGGSLRTWSYRSPAVEQVQVVLSTEGRPLDADIELWHGPDHTPVKMRVYVENGGAGGEWAAPIAGLLVEKHLRGDIQDASRERRVMGATYPLDPEFVESPEP